MAFFAQQQRLPVGSRRQPNAAPVRRGCVVRSAPVTVSEPAATSKDVSPLLNGIQFLNPVWSKIENEEQFFGVLKGYLAKIPGGLEKLLPQWQDFYNNYRNAVVTSGEPGANELLAAKVQSTIADTVTLQFMKPYTFPSHHERILGPEYNYFEFGQRYGSTDVLTDPFLAYLQRILGPEYNYFEFGQRYVGSLINFRASVLGHRERWDKVAAQLAEGHNVVLLANHQTEADPGVFAHMLMSTHPNLATDVIYVAGDRVVTDPLSKPFSMGRNLFCVHSKKHMDDIPELKAQKMETNRKTLVAMQRALNKGKTLIWIAPSGGRDRPKADDRYTPDPFDPAAVELMRNLASRAKSPTHLYPMAMHSWPIMPPPKTVDKAIGERRITNYSGVGISLGAELDIAKEHQGIAEDNKEAQQVALAKAAENAVKAEYDALEAAVLDPSKRGPGTPYTQPWLNSKA